MQPPWLMLSFISTLFMITYLAHQLANPAREREQGNCCVLKYAFTVIGSTLIRQLVKYAYLIKYFDDIDATKPH